tara:strand:- start:2469 stop:2594 length:126 start_codon:yes stop_codon:yes gene_type:complete
MSDYESFSSWFDAKNLKACTPSDYQETIGWQEDQEKKDEED